MPNWSEWKEVKGTTGLDGPKGDTGPAGPPTVGNIPLGAILIWSGYMDDIPVNWVPCDGATHGLLVTPDLRGRFVLGYNDATPDITVGTVGGSRDAVIVSHTHGVTDNGHFHVHSATNSPPGTSSVASGSVTVFTPTVVSAFDTSIETSGVSVNLTGDSPNDANLPPYYVLIYIMRIS